PGTDQPVTATRGEAAAVRAESHGHRPAAMSPEDVQEFSGFAVPQPDLPPHVTRAESSSVRAEGDAADFFLVPPEYFFTRLGQALQVVTLKAAQVLVPRLPPHGLREQTAHLANLAELPGSLGQADVSDVDGSPTFPAPVIGQGFGPLRLPASLGLA